MPIALQGQVQILPVFRTLPCHAVSIDLRLKAVLHRTARCYQWSGMHGSRSCSLSHSTMSMLRRLLMTARTQHLTSAAKRCISCFCLPCRILSQPASLKETKFLHPARRASFSTRQHAAFPNPAQNLLHKISRANALSTSDEGRKFEGGDTYFVA